MAVAGCVFPGCGRKQMTLADVDRPMTIAVTPPLNHSGSTQFDPIKAADFMASELDFLPGVKVISVNRILAQMEAEGSSRVESPAHALQLMQRVGADRIIVSAITEYDPFTPVFGMSAQMYGFDPEHSGIFDAVKATTSPVPHESGMFPQRPRAEHQVVYHAADVDTVKQIKTFAIRRNADKSPHGWRRYTASQHEFVRFCCHETVKDLISQEVAHVQASLDRQNSKEVEQP